MSKYSQKIEKRNMEIRKEKRKQEEEKRKKQLSPEMQIEKKRLKRNLKKIAKIDEQQRHKNDEITNNRRKLRERYLKSLEVGDRRTIELTKKSMLSYDIDLKLNQESIEREL